MTPDQMRAWGVSLRAMEFDGDAEKARLAIDIERQIAAHEQAIAELRKQMPAKPAGRRKTVLTDLLQQHRDDMADIRRELGCGATKAARVLAVRLHMGDGVALATAPQREAELLRKLRLVTSDAEVNKLRATADTLHKLARR